MTLTDIDANVMDRFGLAVTDKVFAELFKVFDLLADYPGMGTVRPDITEERLRFFCHGPNWIIYEPGSPMLIHRIYPAALDMERFRSTV